MKCGEILDELSASHEVLCFMEFAGIHADTLLQQTTFAVLLRQLL